MTLKLNGNLDRLQKNMSALAATKHLPLAALMDDGFIASCSNHMSLNAFFDASGFRVESKEDFAAIPDEEWEGFVVNETHYASWADMQKDAFVKYSKRQLAKGLK